MLKKTVTYTDFNGDEITEDLFFHMSKSELIELELSREGGFAQSLQAIIEAEDGAAIIKEFKSILLASYGVKSADGKRFIKSQELRDEFESSEAYSELFMSLVTDADRAAAFINGLVPSDLVEEAQKIVEKNQIPDGEYEFPQLVKKEPVKLTHADIQAMSETDLQRLPERLASGEVVFA